MNVKKILLASDFSETSQSAAKYAKTLATTLDATLDIATVFDPSVLDFGTTHFTMGGISVWAEKCQKLNAELENKLADVKKQLDVKGETFRLDGNPGKQIVNFANENKYDLVIIGSHGYGKLDRFVLGSVSEYVSRNVNCPVLVVKKTK